MPTIFLIDVLSKDARRNYTPLISEMASEIQLSRLGLNLESPLSTPVFSITHTHLMFHCVIFC